MIEQDVAAAPRPHVVAWESTRACNLACLHCRASAETEPAPDELTTAEVKALVDDIAGFSRPVFIISGGEPLMRPDIFEVARYGMERGLRVVMSPNGTLITPKVAQAMAAAGIPRISVSIDGSTAERHDRVRGVPGAFDAAMAGLAHAREAGVRFQLNTSVMRQTLDDLPALHALAQRLGAEAWHVFMLVPTGRGQAGDEITPAEYERTLNWIYDTSRTSPVPVRVTCGPHYMRIVATRSHRGADAGNGGGSRTAPTDGDGGCGGSARTAPTDGGGGCGGGSRTAATAGMDRATRGCLAGNGYCFVSHRGEVFPCGYLPLEAGNVRTQSFREIYQRSGLFRALRDLSRLEGKCGVCEYAAVCGGCRARAYSATGNVLAEEPFCLYRPRAWK